MSTWFTRKKFGWGWVPISLEGWILTAAYVYFLVTNIIVSNISWWPTTKKIFVFGGLTLIFMVVADKHTDKPLLFKNRNN